MKLRSKDRHSKIAKQSAVRSSSSLFYSSTSDEEDSDRSTREFDSCSSKSRSVTHKVVLDQHRPDPESGFCEVLEEEKVDSAFRLYVNNIRGNVMPLQGMSRVLYFRDVSREPDERKVSNNQSVEEDGRTHGVQKPFALCEFSEAYVFVGITGRVVTRTGNLLEFVYIDEERSRLKFPNDTFKTNFLDHLCRWPRLYDKKHLPYQEPFESKPKTFGDRNLHAKCLERWELVQHNLDYIEGSDVWVEEVKPGAKFLV
jgi:hypothetical protein